MASRRHEASLRWSMHQSVFSEGVSHIVTHALWSSSEQPRLEAHIGVWESYTLSRVLTSRSQRWHVDAWIREPFTNASVLVVTTIPEWPRAYPRPRILLCSPWQFYVRASLLRRTCANFVSPLGAVCRLGSGLKKGCTATQLSGRADYMVAWTCTGARAEHMQKSLA